MSETGYTQAGKDTVTVELPKDEWEHIIRDLNVAESCTESRSLSREILGRKMDIEDQL